MHEIPMLFLKILQGEHLNDANIDYFISDEIDIECKNEDKQFITDIDGEEGPDFPLHIKVKKNLIRIYLPK